MPRIAIVDRADMNAEQARVYDVAKQTTGIVGGPYHAYIRLPKVFEACQHMRATLAAGPLSRREQQMSTSPSPGIGTRAIPGTPRRATRSPSASSRQ